MNLAFPLPYIAWTLLCGVATAQCPALVIDQSSPAQKKTMQAISIAFSKSVPIVLMSHGGVWGGHDDDLTLTLRKDGSALITKYGFNISKNLAKYRVDANGDIRITLNDGIKWIPMPVDVVDGMLTVRAPTLTAFRDAAVSAGIDTSLVTPESLAESYDQWPLRQILDKADGG